MDDSGAIERSGISRVVKPPLKEEQMPNLAQVAALVGRNYPEIAQGLLEKVSKTEQWQNADSLGSESNWIEEGFEAALSVARGSHDPSKRTITVYLGPENDWKKAIDYPRVTFSYIREGNAWQPDDVGNTRIGVRGHTIGLTGILDRILEGREKGLTDDQVRASMVFLREAKIGLGDLERCLREFLPESEDGSLSALPDLS